MPDPKRNELIRILAAIDQLLAEAESIAKDLMGEDSERTRAVIAEFQKKRQAVEAELRGE
jgi:hypothetical protein